MASTESSRYYDIDDFLSDEELIPCTTQFEFSLLAHLKTDATSKERHLPKKTKLQMPIWTLREWSRLNYVRLSVPKKYSSSARDSVKADPLNFELTDSYFRSGKAVSNLLTADHAEAEDLKDTLLLTYTGKRLAKTLDWALSSGSGEDISVFLSKLTSLERRLYESGSNKRRKLA